MKSAANVNMIFVLISAQDSRIPEKSRKMSSLLYTKRFYHPHSKIRDV